MHCKVAEVAKKLMLGDKHTNEKNLQLPSYWILARKSEIYSNWSPLGSPSDLACTVRAIIEFLDKEYKYRYENPSNHPLY